MLPFSTSPAAFIRREIAVLGAEHPDAELDRQVRHDFAAVDEFPVEAGTEFQVRRRVLGPEGLAPRLVHPEFKRHVIGGVRRKDCGRRNQQAQQQQRYEESCASTFLLSSREVWGVHNDHEFYLTKFLPFYERVSSVNERNSVPAKPLFHPEKGSCLPGTRTKFPACSTRMAICS